MTSPEQAPLSEAAAQRDTIIFIPAWNEAENLPAVFQDIAEHDRRHGGRRAQPWG
jgi:hypothetical protein